MVQGDIELSSPDQSLTLSIADGTKITGADGGLVQSISASPIAPPAGYPGYHILKAFDFEPAGASFDPGITITISFNEADVPTGATLLLALYNETAGEWMLVAGCNNDNGTATFEISHFSIYSLIYDDDSPSPASAGPGDKGLSSNELIATGIAAALIAALIVALVIHQMRVRRHATEPAKKRSGSSRGPSKSR